jgi:hypothetical protein
MQELLTPSCGTFGSIAIDAIPHAKKGDTRPVKKLILFAMLAAACGGKSNPAPAPTPDPAPADGSAKDCAEGPPSTPEECECHGWLVVGDIGDGQVRCPDGATEVSHIRYGIEGGLCCDPGKPAE